MPVFLIVDSNTLSPTHDRRQQTGGPVIVALDRTNLTSPQFRRQQQQQRAGVPVIVAIDSTNLASTRNPNQQRAAAGVPLIVAVDRTNTAASSSSSSRNKSNDEATNRRQIRNQMADALVANTTMPTRYFCHVCNVEINIPNENFTCPICSGGFVEELPALAPMNTSGASTSRTANGTTAVNDRDPFNRLAALMALRGEFARMAGNEDGNDTAANQPTSQQDAQQQQQSQQQQQGVTQRTLGSGPPRAVRQNIGPNFLIDFLNSLDGHFGNTSMVYLGNIGDYAWGREGIDTIVTQLLNQMETAGPPPLPKEKIQEIPQVKVTKEEVDKKTQCSVCWEDFVLDETVRKLPCSHIYHENCIVPWLDLHGTCPICRKSLNGDDDDDETGDPNDLNAGHTQHTRNPHTDGSAGGGGRGGSRSAGGLESLPPTIQNSALDDLD